MIGQLYWRLAYADGHEEDEPEDNASILLAHDNALEVHVCRETAPHRREKLMSVKLSDEAGLFKPIFYRKKSMAMGDKTAHTDAVVIGRARLADNLNRAERRRLKREGREGVKFQGALWATLDNGANFVDCPPGLIDQQAIDHLVTTTF